MPHEIADLCRTSLRPSRTKPNSGATVASSHRKRHTQVLTASALSDPFWEDLVGVFTRAGVLLSPSALPIVSQMYKTK